jgi:hypothetical protein
MTNETIETAVSGDTSVVENNVEVEANVEPQTETPDAVEAAPQLAEDLTIDDLLGLSGEQFPELADNANHKGMKPLHSWMQHLPEDVRKHLGNLRSSYTRKTQELATIRKELEQERIALEQQRNSTLNNPAYKRAVEIANNQEEFDLYDPDGMKREIERQAALQLKAMLEPAREQIKMEQRKMELERFKSQHPEITDDAYRQPIAKMLMERPELRLEDAYFIVKAKVDASKLEAEKAQLEAQRATRRAALKQTSSGANASPSGTPKFRDAWSAYQFHKANQQKI